MDSREAFKLRNHRDETEKLIKYSDTRQHKLFTSKPQVKSCVDVWLTLKGWGG